MKEFEGSRGCKTPLCMSKRAGEERELKGSGPIGKSLFEEMNGNLPRTIL